MNHTLKLTLAAITLSLLPVCLATPAQASPTTPSVSALPTAPVDSTETTSARAELNTLNAEADRLTKSIADSAVQLTTARATAAAAQEAAKQAGIALNTAQKSFDSYVNAAYKQGPATGSVYTYMTLIQGTGEDLSSLAKLEHVGSSQANTVDTLETAQKDVDAKEKESAVAQKNAETILNTLTADSERLDTSINTKRVHLASLVAADTTRWEAQVEAARLAAEMAASVESSEGLMDEEGTAESSDGTVSAGNSSNLNTTPRSTVSTASVVAAGDALVNEAVAAGADPAAFTELNPVARVVAASEAVLRAKDAANPGSVAFTATGRPRGAVAVETALNQLGDPYVWGASGPSSFDCSGLTLFSWRTAGVGLPHYSGAQYSGETKVASSDLQPGDLVFFGSPIHHVGMYLGGGLMVHAPHTGDVVKIAKVSVMKSYVGASRPS